jgi:hypothetical protein
MKYEFQYSHGFSVNIVVSIIILVFLFAFYCISAHQTHHAYEGGKSA